MYSEQEIINGCISNKREYQKLLYQKFSGIMLSICLRYCKNQEEAEDILQDGFVKVFKNIDKFQGAGSFEGWVKRIIVNTALEELRKKKRMLITESIDEINTQFESIEKTDEMLNAKELLKLIQALPDGYQLVFNLYVIEGYSHKEISEMLNINEGTSKSQLSKARAYIKNLITKSERLKEVDSRK